MESIPGSDFTVAELKEALRERGLPTSGVKNELIKRLSEHNPDVWKELGEQRKDAPLRTDSDPEGVHLAEGGDGMSGAGTTDEGMRARRGPETVAACDLEARENAMRRELELLRRERDCAEREQQLWRRELEVLRNSPAVRGTTTESGTSSMPGGVRGIKDLLPEFDGTDNAFWRWEQQLKLLRQSYNLDESSTRMLISSRLKGRALSWFYSRAEYLTLGTDDLLIKMGQMFDLQPGKLALRREFEARVWKKGESFSEYYHDKMILANRIPVAENEILDYLIEGVTDVQLRNQACLMNYTTGAELLKAFQKVRPEDGRSSNVRTGKAAAGAASSRKAEPAAREKTVRCYRCREAGHVAAQCRQAPAKRTCYVCGSAEHLARECSRRDQASTSGTARDSAAAVSTNVVHPVDLPKPYMLRVKITPENASEKCTYIVDAMVDSGSPVSLVRSDAIACDARRKMGSEYPFCGINGSRLRIDGIFSGSLEVGGVEIAMKFYSVPRETMAFDVLLGRDFLNCPRLCVTFGDTVEITGVEEKRAISSLMHIDCGDDSVHLGDELKIDPAVDASVSVRISEAYESCYLKNLREPKSMPDFEMNIALKHEQPISSRPRRLSFADKEILRKILDDLLERAIIRPSSSPYASPIVMVRKKDGGCRLCVDYRELNKITIRDNFPTELIDDNIDRLQGKMYFSILDLRDGFHHVRMHESSTKYTSFVTPLGQFEYLRMPFGLANAPRVFQRYVHTVFEPLIRSNKILVYLDDLLVATKDINEHIEILSEVFEIAGKNKLQFRLDKCYFARTEIKYLGYCVNSHGVRPSDENIESVVNYPIPRNVREMQRFIGLASYFRRFIPSFSVIAKPLYDVIKKNATYKFGAVENSVFETLKRQLSSKPVLAIYSPRAETELHCDASASGFGGILLQRQTDGAWRPISFWSQRTTPAESKYHSFELECLAAVYALKRYPCKSTTTEETIKHLSDYVRAYGRPRRLISDRGTCFTSEVFKEFVRSETIEHVLVAVSTPRANGQVERYNRMITPMLAKLCEIPSRWDRVLDKIEFSINNTVCRVTGETPTRLLFGIEQRGPANDSLREIIEENVNIERNLDALREKASRKINEEQRKGTERYNLRRKAARKYKVGEYVEIRNVETAAGINKKLIPKYKGPYMIKKVLDHDRYVVVDVEGFQLTQRPYTGVLAPDQMRPYIHS